MLDSRFSPILHAFVLSLMLGLSTAFAQVSDEAASWLTCAAEAIGPEGVELTTAQDAGIVTYFGPNGAPIAALDYVSIVDIEGERFRFDLFIGDQLVAVQQVTPEGGFLYAPETGTVEMPESELARYREAFVTGAVGLRLGADRERAEVNPAGELGGVPGVLIELVTKGVEHAVLLDEDCRMLGERTFDPDLGEIVSLGRAEQPIDGWWLPLQVETYAMGGLFATIETTSMTINAAIDDAAFERP